MLYLCGGRSFNSARVGRKISGVVGCWRKSGAIVHHVCGGDYSNPNMGNRDVENSNDLIKKYGARAYHEKWYRKSIYLAFFERSLSELRDILHDNAMSRDKKINEHAESSNIIWERSSRLHMAGLKLAKKYRKIYVLEWKDHLIPYSYSIFRPLARQCEKLKVKHADFIVVESETLKEYLVDLGAERARIIVANNAVDPGEFLARRDTNRREDLGINNKTKVVGYLGSYADYHNTLLLPDAIELLVSNGQADFKVVMIGDGKNREAFEAKVREKSLTDYFVFVDPIVAQQVPEYLSVFDFAVLPGSTNIICPIKVQEYMAAGLPVVLPDYPCNEEVVSHLKEGFLFTEKDPDALAQAIGFYLQDLKSLKTSGELARAKAFDSFSWEATWGRALSEVTSNISKAGVL